MRITDVACTIERRLLINYRITPESVAPLLPEPFVPQVIDGWAVGGVCFLRLRHLRPAQFPRAAGFTTENVAHRFAVEWSDELGAHCGVYVPQRHTDSRLTSAAGGRLFPGHHHLARFRTSEVGENMHIDVVSRDRSVSLSASTRSSPSLDSELFGSVAGAMEFFRRGSLGFSPSHEAGHLEGVRLLSSSWTASAVRVEDMGSSLFDDDRVFPPGTCILDSGLVMRNLPVLWRAQAPLRQQSPAGTR
jgi:hypothetical protein